MRLRAFALLLLASFFSLPALAMTPEAEVDLFNRTLDPRAVLHVALSPDGKHLIEIDTDGFHQTLVLIDADSGASKTLFHGARVEEGHWIFDKEPYSVIWVTNDLLAIDYGVEAQSMDLNGKTVAELGQDIIRKALPNREDSSTVLVYTDVENGDIAAIDARSGEKTRYRVPMSGTVIHPAFDKAGMLRAVTMSDSAFWKDSTTISNWYKPDGNADWVKLDEFKLTDDYWTPMFVPDEPDTLIVSSGAGRDTRAVFLYNTKTRELGKMLAGHPDQDILNIDGDDLEAPQRVASYGMKPEQHWLDPKWAKIQASIDLTLPGSVNRLSGDPKNRVLIFSYSDVDPGRWYLMDVPHMTMSLVAKVHPAIDPAQMLPVEVISYKAADDLTIPAYLTKPAAATTPMPTVVMIHGGPNVRDMWGWDPDVQVLAANGYVVFQPQFRGSRGFGRKFEEAGYRQWGLAMQDDITAGVEYLIKQGIADPNRICIYGASYGGYAALWGLAKTPKLYRCGISFAGVSDIGYMLNDWSDRNSNKRVREIQRFRVGDPHLNQQQFDDVSPVKHADRIIAPVLILHGSNDERVPISHSKKMIDALKANGKTYEWHEMQVEGHGISYTKDKAFFYANMLEFLNRYIGPVEEKSVTQTPAGTGTK